MLPNVNFLSRMTTTLILSQEKEKVREAVREMVDVLRGKGLAVHEVAGAETRVDLLGWSNVEESGRRLWVSQRLFV